MVVRTNMQQLTTHMLTVRLIMYKYTCRGRCDRVLNSTFGRRVLSQSITLKSVTQGREQPDSLLIKNLKTKEIWKTNRSTSYQNK